MVDRFDPAPFLLHAPPYHRLLTVGEPGQLSGMANFPRGMALVWNLVSGDPSIYLPLARARPAGLALIAVLPPAERLLDDRLVLDIIEGCRPQGFLPFHPEPDPHDLNLLLRRPPENLAVEVMDYLGWRGVRVDLDTRRLMRRTLELAGELTTVSGLARSLYMSRRALGRRFLTRGLPVPSHWLHFGRVLRAALRLQNSDDSLFDVATELGYPDGFALSNQMKRLTGIRPTTARVCSGWEWLVEAWIEREMVEGGMSDSWTKAPVRSREGARRRASVHVET